MPTLPSPIENGSDIGSFLVLRSFRDHHDVRSTVLPAGRALGDWGLKTAQRVRYLAVPPKRTGDLHARYALFLTSLPSQDKLVWGDVELLGWRGI